jgi:hypothetical protein
MDNSKMKAAYGAARRIIREKQTVQEQQIIDDLSGDDIVVVRGQYDRVEEVLGVMDLPHVVVDPERLSRLDLRPDQMLVINCPGNIDQKAVKQVRNFVNAGGSLFTTDWALKYVLEPAFPGIVEFNDKATPDAVVGVQPTASENPMLDGIFDEAADPQWWLERSSYPIKVLDPGKVEVLVDSAELGRRWGESPVVISFEYGLGEVLHMISHYYLQRTELRTKRHTTNWAGYAAEKNAMMSTVGAPEAYKDLNVGEVEAAYTSSRMMRNGILEYKRRAMERIDREAKSD